MNNHDLENLYRSTEEDMQFAIGLVALPGREPAPIIQIRYRDWTREKLKVVCERAQPHRMRSSSRMINTFILPATMVS